MVVPLDHLWIEGDNEEKSLDSNHYGPVHKDLVTGVAYGIVYPLNNARILSRKEDENTSNTLNFDTSHILSMFVENC